MGDRLWIDFAREPRLGQEGLGLGGERQAIAIEPVVQRLLAESIPGDEQPLSRRVPQGEREHPVEAFHARRTPLPVGGEDDLGVALAAEGVAPGRQLGLQLAVVVDLAVVGDGERAVGGAHRLRAAGAEVDDRQSAMAEAHRAVAVHAVAVRAAMGDEVAHRLHRPGRHRGARGEVHAPGDAAHDETLGVDKDGRTSSA